MSKSVDVYVPFHVLGFCIFLDEKSVSTRTRGYPIKVCFTIWKCIEVYEGFRISVKWSLLGRVADENWTPKFHMFPSEMIWIWKCSLVRDSARETKWQ